MVTERVTFGAVPALAVHAGSATDAAARGTVLVYHPLGADKSVHEEDLARLARSGFLGVSVDAIAHGERRIPDAAARFRADPFRALLEVVTATVAEVPGLVDALVGRGWAVPGRIGIAGISLGGFVAYGAVTAERRLAAAVCVNASPWWGADPRSPHRHADRFFPAALLSMTAAEDPVVPPDPARTLHATLGPVYAEFPERLRYVELPGERHHLSPAARARVRQEADGWFERFLAAPLPAS